MAKKDDRSADSRNEENEMIDSDEGGGSRVYELGFHIDPELPTEEVKKVYQGVKEVVEKQGALVAEGEPEQIQLAYTISRQDTAGRRDFNSAHFAWVAYETSAPNHEEVLNTMKADPRIVRFLDVVTSKDAARHAAEIRLLQMKAPKPAEEKDASDAELDAALEEAAA